MAVVIRRTEVKPLIEAILESPLDIRVELDELLERLFEVEE